MHPHRCKVCNEPIDDVAHLHGLQCAACDTREWLARKCACGEPVGRSTASLEGRCQKCENARCDDEYARYTRQVRDGGYWTCQHCGGDTRSCRCASENQSGVGAAGGVGAFNGF